MTETEYMRPLTPEERWQGIDDLSAFKYAFADSDDQGEAYQLCAKYAGHLGKMLENGIGIRLHGEVGTGKTFYASCIGTYARLMGYRPAWIDCKTFIATMADYKTRNENYIERILGAQILIIDDLDTKKLNSLELACLFRLINAREGKLNIITTNMTPAAISNNEATDMDEKRALSRIQELCPLAVVLQGSDRRKDIAARKKKKALQIFQGGAN